MSGLQLADVKVGDAFEVLFPNTVEHSYMCMVTETFGNSVQVHNIGVNVYKDEPLTQSALVTQKALELPQLRVGRQILRPHPEYRWWSDVPHALLSFSRDQPEVPTGLTLAELARCNDGQFILADRPSAYEPGTATYRPPFYDYKTARIVRQYVTVYRLNGGVTMLKRKPVETTEEYRPVLPEGATFTRMDEGPVLSGVRGALWIGEKSSAKREYPLYRGEYFAIETRVLKRAFAAS